MFQKLKVSTHRNTSIKTLQKQSLLLKFFRKTLFLKDLDLLRSLSNKITKSFYLFLKASLRYCQTFIVTHYSQSLTISYLLDMSTCIFLCLFRGIAVEPSSLSWIIDFTTIVKTFHSAQFSRYTTIILKDHSSNKFVT